MGLVISNIDIYEYNDLPSSDGIRQKNYITNIDFEGARIGYLVTSFDYWLK